MPQDHGDADPPPAWFTEAEWARVLAELSLSSRQAEVLRGVLASRSDRATAERLEIAVPTVRSHLGALFDLVGVNDRTSLALEIIRIALGRNNTQQRPKTQQIDD